MGPIERLRPVNPAVEGCAYRPGEGIGKNVGVEGRDDGVGMELVVDVVLALAADNRDCGRRIPVFIVLLYSDVPLSACTGGDEAAVDAPRRKEVGAGGLDVLLRSFPTSLTGEGESSIMSTQPDVSATGVLFALVSSSTLRRPGGSLMVRSSRAPLLRREVDRIIFMAVEVVGEYMLAVLAGCADNACTAVAFAFDLPFMLPIRIRGTRVCIFCSKIFTRARISVTICTPLLLEAVADVVEELMVEEEMFRVTMGAILGRGAGVRGGIRDGERVGNVVERAIPDGLDELLGLTDADAFKPARFRAPDCPLAP